MRISDWSSDVCSSDLSRSASVFSVHMLALLGRRSEKSRKTAQLHSRLHISSRDRDRTKREANPVMCCRTAVFCRLAPPLCRSHGEVAVRSVAGGRSEERRVGDEWVGTGRSRWGTYP